MRREAGLIKLGHVELDGTKVRAQASFRNNVTGEEVLKRERWLAQRVEELLREAAKVDAAEEARYGKAQRGDELPAELTNAQQRLARLRELRQRIAEEAEAPAAAPAQQRKQAGGKPRNEAVKKQ